MKTQTQTVTIATALAFAALWVVCSIFVAIIPTLSMSVTEAMIHANLSSMTWSLTFTSFTLGLIAWSVLGGTTAGLISVIYNKISK